MQRFRERRTNGHAKGGVGFFLCALWRLRLVLAKVDYMHRWQLRPAGAIGKCQQLVLPRGGVGPALQAGCGAPQYNDSAFRARAYDGDFSRVVARRLALLVARLMFL